MDARTAVKRAIDHLRSARDLLRVARAPQAMARVRKALKSAEGAERHAWRVHMASLTGERLRRRRLSRRA